MEEKVKQRLIGVIVIIGALFIILPFLFHNSRPSAESKLSANAPASGVSVTLPAASTTAANATPAISAATTSSAQTTAQPAATDMSSSQTAPQTTQTTQTAQPSADTTTAPETPDAVAQTKPATPTPAAATATTTTTVSSNNSFSAAPNALTTGQANEGPAQPATTTVAQSAAPTQQPVAVTTTPTTPTTPVVKKQTTAMKKMPLYGNNGAWEVQLAVFSDKAYANNLVTKLRSHHFEVYSRRVVVNHRPLVAVLVGPEINLQKAQMIQQRLRQEFHLNGVIRKHQA